MKRFVVTIPALAGWTFASVTFINTELSAGVHPADPETGRVDGTHLNAKGGEVVGEGVAAELVDVVPALGSHFKK